MSRIRTKRVRRITREILMKFPDIFTTDFEENKKILNKIAVFRSKTLRNKVAGYITFLMKKKKELEEKIKTEK